MTEHVAVLDIGGTKTAAALVRRDGDVVRRSETSTPAQAGPDAVLDAAADLVADLCRHVPVAVALGVGSAGVVDPVGGTVLGATDSLAGWAGTDLRGELTARTGLPTAVANDVHAHALGEGRYGAGRGRASMLLVAVGTGIGGGLLLPHGLLVGARAAAGHVGHVPCPAAVDLPCSCGGVGHLEALASGPALVAEYRRRGGEANDLRAVAAAAAQGETRAYEVLRLGGEAVGQAVGGFVNVMDPEVVVIGGGVASVGDPWWSALVAAARAELLPVTHDVEIVRSALGVDAALLGAAALAWELVDGEQS